MKNLQKIITSIIGIFIIIISVRIKINATELNNLKINSETIDLQITIENNDVENYNNYVMAYNIITDNIYKVIKEYGNNCGLKEEYIYKNNKIQYVLNDGKIDEFYKIIELPLNLNVSEKHKEIKKEYVNLYESLSSICYFYERSRTFYNRNSSEIDQGEAVRIHKQFINSYENFKNQYTSFSKIITEYSEKEKYEDIIWLSDVNLDVHEKLNKILVITSELNNVIMDFTKRKPIQKDIEKYNFEKANFNIMSKDLKNYTNEYFSDYGLTDIDKTNVKLFIYRLEKLQAIYLEVENYINNNNYEEVSYNKDLLQEYKGFYNDMVRLYNKLY